MEKNFETTKENLETQKEEVLIYDEIEIFEHFSRQQSTKDPLENETNEKSQKKNSEVTKNCSTTTGKVSTKNVLNEIVESIMERSRNPVEITDGITEETLLTYEAKIRKPRIGETEEEQEKRLLKSRLTKFKNRLLLKIEKPEKAAMNKSQVTRQTRLRREKRLAIETHEETRARKQQAHNSSINLRKRIQELETIEQKAERMAKERENSRLRLHKKRANETTAERLARKKEQRDYQKQRRPQSCLAIRTGKFYDNRNKSKTKEVS